MIAVDTSALMAVVLGKPAADACIAALESEDAQKSAHTLVAAEDPRLQLVRRWQI